MAGNRNTGFTLIELSITLVIIGLLMGVVLTGSTLIGQAAMRAQISQINQFNAAANTFQAKYGYLPGDIPASPALAAGLAARGSSRGQGDGNGVIEGSPGGAGGCADGTYGCYEGSGETPLFWRDLSVTGLIGGSFTTASCCVHSGSTISQSSNPSLSAYFPVASIGGNHVIVFSWQGVNYFNLVPDWYSYVDPVNNEMAGNNGLSVAEAFGIDSKIDDGLPQSGSVTAQFVFGESGVAWSDFGYGPFNPASTSPIPSSAGSCYDNGNVNGVTQHYSTEVSSGNLNCALAFQFP